MIGNHFIKSFFIGINRWNTQLFHSHCLNYFTDTTKAQSIFIHISDFLSVDKSAAISQSLVTEVIDKVCTFLQAINILLHHNMADSLLPPIYKKLLYDCCWLICFMDKLYLLFIMITPEIVCFSLITCHFDLDMPQSSFVFFEIKLSNENRNVAMLPNVNSLLSHFELVINRLYVPHNMPAIFSEHGF
jgi:hypothetical protein